MAVSSHAVPFKSSLPHPLFCHRFSSRSLATSSFQPRFCYSAAKERNEFLLLGHECELPHNDELLHKDIQSRQRTLPFSSRQLADPTRNNRTVWRPRVSAVPSVPGEVRLSGKHIWNQVTEEVRNRKKHIARGLVELQTSPPAAQESSQLNERPYKDSGFEETSVTSVSHSPQATTLDIAARLSQLKEQIVEELKVLDAKDLEHFKDTGARLIQLKEQIVEELDKLDAKHLEHFKEGTGSTRKAWPANGLSSGKELVDVSSYESNDVDEKPVVANNNWPNGLSSGKELGDGSSYESSALDEKPVVANNNYFLVEGQTDCEQNLRTKLCSIFDKVLVVDNVTIARKVVHMLTHQYRDLVHACDTEVSKINVKQETPVHHGEVICFSIFSGEDVNYGNGKSCIWVDVLDGEKDILVEFAPFFQDSAIKKVWHNYSFDCHVLENYGIKLAGFHADTMHMARLWDSSRRIDGGYSLEALTGNPKVMNESQMYQEEDLIGKISMKTIFGRRKMKKDGALGKIVTIPPVEELQREERQPWICYSSLDSMSTLKLYQSLKSKLSKMPWLMNGRNRGNMLNFYESYWQPFGELLVQMETEGILVDKAYLSEVEKVAIAEQKIAADRFRNWASKHCADAKYMNVGSDTQLRQLLFGGICNRKNHDESLPTEKLFKIANVDNIVKEGKKAPLKNRDIKLHKIGSYLHTDLFTATGWPSVSGDALKAISGKVSAAYDFSNDASEFSLADDPHNSGAKDVDDSAYGTAYSAFGGGQEGREACHAIAALCEMCSIDSLISNFILPLQGSHVSGNSGRIHCSLNINTETGRLSARRPNLQNQPALEKDRYKIRQAFIAAPGNSLIVADYGQLELRILAHLADCKSMKEAFEAGGDFHSRTAMNMYPYIREAVEQNEVILEWHPQPGEEKPPVPLLKDAFGSERRKAKMLNFSIAYGKTPMGLAKDWKVSVNEAKKTVELWYKERQEVLRWQEARKKEAEQIGRVHTLLGRARLFPSMRHSTSSQRGHIERAAINTPVQGSAADVAMCAMLEINSNERLKELGWKLLLQVHDEVILEGPTESSEEAKALVIDCMAKPFNGKNILTVDLVVDAKCAQNWYAAK